MHLVNKYSHKNTKASIASQSPTTNSRNASADDKDSSAEQKGLATEHKEETRDAASSGESAFISVQRCLSSNANAAFDLDTPITLTEYRILMGMSTAPEVPVNSPQSVPIYFPFLPIRIRKFWSKPDPEAVTSIYSNVLKQQTRITIQYHLFEGFVYTTYILQLIISAALIILGAVPVKETAGIAILGAVNGILAGLLSLMKGQGLPMRLIKYAEV
jgi:hypothetical protein